MLGLCAGFAVAQELDGEEVHSRGEFWVLELAAVEVGGSGEGVDEDEGGLGRVVGVGHLVAC